MFGVAAYNFFAALIAGTIQASEGSDKILLFAQTAGRTQWAHVLGSENAVAQIDAEVSRRGISY